VDSFGEAYTNKFVRDAEIEAGTTLFGYTLGGWLGGLIAKIPKVGGVIGAVAGFGAGSFVDMIVPCEGCSVGEEAVFIQLALTPNNPAYARASVGGGSVHTYAQWYGSDN